MTRLLVELDAFTEAAGTMSNRVAEPTYAAWVRLDRILGGCGGMAGGDPAGSSWASEYDPVARQAMAGLSTVVRAAHRTATLFARSARNYAAAEDASTSGPDPGLAARLATLPAEIVVGEALPPPAAGGGGGNTPDGWWLIEHTVGYLWPDGHQDRLRRAARAWRDCAAVVADAASAALAADASFQADGLPEADDIVTVCESLRDHMADLVEVVRALGASCDELAAHIDRCHAEVRSELTELLVETAAIQTGGAILGALTFGIAEAPAQALQATRIAAAAARVGRVIERFAVLARRVVESFGRLGTVARNVAEGLQGLAGAKLAYAGVTDVRRASQVARVGGRSERNLIMMREARGEAGALGRLRAAAEGETRFASKSEAREAFAEGPLRQHARDFFKKATGKSGDYKVIAIEDGSYRLEYFSRADNPGYGKLYVRIVNRAGDMIADFKDTLGPAGLISRKDVPHS